MVVFTFTRCVEMANCAEPDHAARMDGIYSIQRHVYDFSRKYYLLGRDRLIAGLNIPTQGTALEIGCGTGRNIALAAHRYPSAKLRGIDISSEMLRTAESKLARLAASRDVQIAQADATSLDALSLFGQVQFDRVWFSYTLSMIPDWPTALQQAANCIAPGGSLHIVDFGQQRSLPVWFRAMLHGWLRKFHVTPRATLLDMCERLAQRRGWRMESATPYRDYAWLITLSRP